MPPRGSKTTGELIIVHQQSRESRTRARAHLAQNGIRKRIEKQRGKDHDSLSPPGPKAVVAPPISPPVALSGFSMVEYLISTNIFPDLSSTWGVSPAVCPGPANLSHTLSRASDVLECIFRASLAFHWLDLNLWATPEKKRNMKVAALTYRGQALALAQKELLRCHTSGSKDCDTIQQPVHPANREICFSIVLRMLQLDYRFARCDVQAHFVACRQLLRGSSYNNRTADQRSVEALASTIRNPHLHHLMITFECINCTPNSVIWDDADLDFLTRRLFQLVDRLRACDVASTENRIVGETRPLTPARISPSTILWRCLTKRPMSIPSNIYRDVCEFSAQIAALLLICSVFLDYEDGSEGANTSIPCQCVEELENALFALGEENAVSSALNTAWLLAGGLGLPLTQRRARLWTVSGMLYALKRSTSLDLTVATSDDVVNAQYVKQVCLEFLGNPGRRP
ncbi:hypothetical protein BDV38DRAFT_55103 [Aspergillus pseudotamarii]|uniref:Uncharacterized protein n=1 Tax=Aspergillus pseudotamarii TaxID=132259 RepID=A0A5N6T0V0_ASPPS|nr:uncharacterized protein BDV38DRAFT_55103 [Aspergillus pseudotamarii]KAE8139224.1 hypothetical protein BDV38DRAFT_55103 [Aspergillus pseudotamarii]